MPVTLNIKPLLDLEFQLQKLQELVVVVGFLGQKAAQLYATGINVATVGFIQEFGTDAKEDHPGIPGRSFIRSTLIVDRNMIARRIGREVSKVVKGNLDALEAMSEIGRFVAGRIKRRIDRSRSWAKRNAPSTVEKKGFNWPLHDSFLMSRSITWAVRRFSVEGEVIRTGSP